MISTHPAEVYGEKNKLWGCEMETQDMVLVGDSLERVYVSHIICCILCSISTFMSAENLVFMKCP